MPEPNFSVTGKLFPFPSESVTLVGMLSVAEAYARPAIYTFPESSPTVTEDGTTTKQVTSSVSVPSAFPSPSTSTDAEYAYDGMLNVINKNNDNNNVDNFFKTQHLI